MKKRFLSVLLALALCLSLLPTMAWAENVPIPVDVTDAEVETSSESGTTVTLTGTIENGTKSVILTFELNAVYESGTTYSSLEHTYNLTPSAEIEGADGDEVSTASITVTWAKSGLAVEIDATVNMVDMEESSGYSLSAHWDDYQEHGGVKLEPWPGGTALPTEAGDYNIYLKGNVTLDATWTVPEGTTNLCLNGHVIKMNGPIGSVIKVPANATLNLFDCGETEHYFIVGDNGLWTLTDAMTEATKTVTGGVITGGKADYGGGVNVSGNGAFTITGGNIVGNTANIVVKGQGGSGGGVYVSNGTFTMTGGNIIGNTAQNNGGGVFVGSNGTFTMSGSSKISGNSSYSGAGVYSEGEFTMSGDSEIAYNKGSCGGGVFVNANSFTMSGNSRVAYNEGTMWCGGVDVTNGGTFTMYENSEITDNEGAKWGGGVSLFGNANFNMTGGRITDNTTPDCGGGVYVNSGTITLGGAAKITDNVKGGTISDGVLAGGTANNVYLPNNKYITLGSAASAPTGNFKIGVTTQTAPTDGVPVKITTNGASTDTNYFSSDNANYEIKFNTDHLELAVKTIPSTTIADILPGDFPTAPDNGWVYKGSNATAVAYVYNGKLYFQENGNPTVNINLSTTSALTKNDDNYVVNSEGAQITFVMESNSLVGIGVSSSNQTTLNGTYSRPHAHSFTYVVNGNKITAGCGGEGTCNLPGKRVMLTLTAPANLVYDGSAKEFTFADSVAAAWTGAGLELPTITYTAK